MAWQVEGPDFLPRVSSHFSKVPADPVLTLGLPPTFFPPTLIGVLPVGLDGNDANSGLVVAPSVLGPRGPFGLKEPTLTFSMW